MTSKTLSWADKRCFEQLIVGLKAGKVAVGATDTVLGLLSDTTQVGFDRLNSIKKRGEKPYLVLIAGMDRVADFVCMPLSVQIEKLMDNCWPGPLTIICSARPDISPFLRSKSGTIALRVPRHEGLLSILPHFRGLFSTSANLAGKGVPRSLDELNGQILSQIDYVLEGVTPQSGHELPSTILDCSGDEIKVIREGAYPISELERVAGVSFKR